MEQTIFYIGLLALLMQSAYLAYISFWPSTGNPLSTKDQAHVTVLVCAKNEEDNVDFLIRALLRQSYSNYRILIVDDQSTDETANRVRYWQEKYPERIQLFSLLHKAFEGKKGAIWEALPHIKTKYILFTDADCRPVSKNWIALMMAAFDNGKQDVVLGYSPLQRSKTWLNSLERIQNAWTAWQYIGFAYRGQPYMAIGRNWAVKREFYSHYQNIGIHGQVPSGDDDLVLQALVKKGNLKLQIETAAWMMTWGKPNLKAWWTQRLRHMEAGLHYTLYMKLFLLLFPFSTMLVIAGAIFFFVSNAYVGIAFLAAQFALWLIFARKVLRQLGHGDLIVWFPVLLPLELAFQAIVFLLTLFGKKGTWK
jgi:cellulose synthase/poly-beta-1,6-N-acetylglucosamine synthase-like glycosyltransferase